MGSEEICSKICQSIPLVKTDSKKVKISLPAVSSMKKKLPMPKIVFKKQYIMDFQVKKFLNRNISPMKNC